MRRKKKINAIKVITAIVVIVILCVVSVFVIHNKKKSKAKEDYQSITVTTRKSDTESATEDSASDEDVEDNTEDSNVTIISDDDVTVIEEGE